MTPLDIEIYAAKRKHERFDRLNELTAHVPKRKFKGSEITMLVNALEAMHTLLCHYDLRAEQPGIAGTLETSFDAALAQLADVVPASAD